MKNMEWLYYLLYIESELLNGFYVVGAYSEKQMYTKAYHGEFHRDFRPIPRSLAPINRNVSLENFKRTIQEFYVFDKATIEHIWKTEIDT